MKNVIRSIFFNILLNISQTKCLHFWLPRTLQKKLLTCQKLTVSDTPWNDAYSGYIYLVNYPKPLPPLMLKLNTVYCTLNGWQVNVIYGQQQRYRENFNSCCFRGNTLIARNLSLIMCFSKSCLVKTDNTDFFTRVISNVYVISP